MRISILFFVLYYFGAGAVHAATFADMISSIQDSVLAFGGLMKLFIPLCGLYCIGMGLFKFLGLRVGGERDGRTWHETWRGAIMWILPGAALLAISGFSAVSVESIGLSGTIDF